MRNIVALAISVTILGAVDLAAASSAKAWDWGGMNSDETSDYRYLTRRFLGFQWGANGWMWGLPVRYRAAPSYYPLGYTPSLAPGCRC